MVVEATPRASAAVGFPTHTSSLTEEIAIELPEKPDVVQVIPADDPRHRGACRPLPCGVSTGYWCMHDQSRFNRRR
jgi:hypothetical protein